MPFAVTRVSVGRLLELDKWFLKKSSNIRHLTNVRMEVYTGKTGVILSGVYQVLGSPVEHIKKIKSYLGVNLRLHDPTQYEFDIRYNFQQYFGELKNSLAWTNHKKPFEVDIYFFLPPHASIGKKMTPEDFHKDLRARVRLAEPTVSFKDLLGQSSPSITMIRSIREALRCEKPEDSARRLENLGTDIRMFGCVFYNFFWNRVDRRKKQIRRFAEEYVPGSDGVQTLRDILDNVEKLSKKSAIIWQLWNGLRHEQPLVRVDSDGVEIPEPHQEKVNKRKSQVALVDEFMAYTLQDGVALIAYKLVDLAAKFPELKDQITQTVMNMRAQTLDLLEKHCETLGYHTLSSTSSIQDRERYINRKRSLKSFVFNILYLKEKTPFSYRFKSNLAPMIAAGLAATWAILAQYIILRYTNIIDLSSLSANQNQNLNLSLSGILALSAIVIAYVLKDRIKDLGRSIFSSGLLHKRFHQEKDLLHKGFDGRWKRIGRLQETTTMIDVREINDELARIWKVHRHESYSLGKWQPVLIRYNRKITLSQSSAEAMKANSFDALTDVLRFKVDSFLPHFDNPTETLMRIAENGSVEEISVPKYYYIDVIVVSPDSPKDFQFYRVSLSKSGLQKTDKVA